VADERVDPVVRSIEPDLGLVADERLITCPFLESYILPEPSTILVLGEADELLLLMSPLLLPETALLVEAVPEVLPDKALLFLDDVLPERVAMEEVFLLVAELLL
jgi:hypothetical protein